MSDPVRPHRWQPTRLPRPWDSPGKNTGVGCHFLLQCVKVKSESEVAQLCPTLSDPMDCSLPGSSTQGIFQARGLEWGYINIHLFFYLWQIHFFMSFWTSLSLFIFMHWRRKGQPTPVFLPGESQGRGSLVGCRLWGRTGSDTTEVT